MDNRRQEINAKRKKQVNRQKRILTMLVLAIVIAVSVSQKVENKEIKNNVVEAAQNKVKNKEVKAAQVKEKSKEAKAGQNKEKSKEVKAAQDKEKNKEMNKAATVKMKKRTIEQVRKDAVAKGYPEEVIGLLDKNEETIGFVDNYDKKIKQAYADNIKKDMVIGEMPHLLQWDERWGYASYGTSNMAVSGCGPTCMAMVVAGLTQDTSITPLKMARFAMEQKYVDEENNTYWSFMETAGANWNVNCYGGMFTEEQIKAELEAGHPVICSMGPGDFTQDGHFIVLTGYSDGRVKVKDPFSIKRTEKEWVYADIAEQIRAMWVYSVN